MSDTSEGDPSRFEQAKALGKSGWNKVSSNYQSHAEDRLPTTIKILIALGFLISFIYTIVYFVNLGEGKEGGEETSDDSKGVCGEKCAVSWKKVLWKGFGIPLIIWASFMIVSAFWYWFRVEKKAKEMISARATAAFYSPSYVKKFLIFCLIAFGVWLLVSFGFYVLMSLGNVKIFKQKEYKQYTNKTKCKGAKKSWCKKNSVAPNSFWFFLFSLIFFFVVMVVGVVKYVKSRGPQDALCAEVQAIGDQQISNYRKSGRWGVPTSVDNLLVGNFLGSAEDPEMANTREAVSDALHQARAQNPQRCSSVYNHLQAKIRKFQVKQYTYKPWREEHGGAVTGKRKVTFQDSGRQQVVPQSGSSGGSKHSRRVIARVGGVALDDVSSNGRGGDGGGGRLLEASAATQEGAGRQNGSAPSAEDPDVQAVEL